ncbi:DUF6113 family protein [Streptomyces sp. NPDC087897]|uniref:DUF6113 family protein n=1 Tax=Streptomyces sp. NPDC087897 TaxID=3365817 RepID=UPI003823C9C7
MSGNPEKGADQAGGGTGKGRGRGDRAGVSPGREGAPGTARATSGKTRVRARSSSSSSHAPRRNAPPREPEPVGFAARPNPARIAAHAGLAVLGVLVGLAGTLVQAAWFPGGLAIALAGAAGLFYGGRILTRTQIGALAPAAGWFITVFLLLSGRSEGDYVFGDELGLVLFMLGGTAVAVICATTRRVPQSAMRGVRSGP